VGAIRREATDKLPAVTGKTDLTERIGQKMQRKMPEECGEMIVYRRDGGGVVQLRAKAGTAWL
jgi:hypothetical protein